MSGRQAAEALFTPKLAVTAQPGSDPSVLPLAVALPRMLQAIEAALATAGRPETPRLHWRAGLIRHLLPAAPHGVTNEGGTTGDGSLTPPHRTV